MRYDASRKDRLVELKNVTVLCFLSNKRNGEQPLNFLLFLMSCTCQKKQKISGRCLVEIVAAKKQQAYQY